MSARWTNDVHKVAAALKQVRSVAIFGLCGISLEDQHRVFSLARSLGAYVSVERPLLPTLTLGSLKRHALILLAGGEPDFILPQSAKILRDDRLLTAEAWRSLRILQRARTADGAEEYRDIYETIAASNGAAFLPTVESADGAFQRELCAFRSECALSLGLDVMQLSGRLNLLGAYETALEEAGGAHALLCAGTEKADDAFALPELLRQNVVEAALLIGESVFDTALIRDAGVPLYVLGGAVPGAGVSISTARLGESAGGTILRDDGVPVSMEAVDAGELPKLRDVLDALHAEVNA